MKIAILLPKDYDVACLRKARKLAEAAIAGRNLRGQAFSVAIGLPEKSGVNWQSQEKFLLDGLQRTVVRHLVWENVSPSNAARMYPWCTRNQPVDLESVIIPRDWGANFLDCDLWFNIADPAAGAIFTLRPTAHFCASLDFRQFPSSFAENRSDLRWGRAVGAFQLWRSDELVVVEDKASLRNLVSFAGVRPDATMLIEGLSEGIDASRSQFRRSERPRNLQAVAWRVDVSVDHDLSNAVKGLRYYLAEGGSLEFQIVTEDSEESFGKDSSIQAIKNLSPACRQCLSNLKVERISGDEHLFRLLSGVGGVWASKFGMGQGTGILEAWSVGLPALAPATSLHRDMKLLAPDALDLYEPSNPLVVADELHAFEARLKSGFDPNLKRTYLHSPSIFAQKIGFVIDRLMEHFDA